RVIIPCPKPHKLRSAVVQSPREPKWLEAGVRIQEHPAELIVLHALGHSTCGDFDDQPWAAEVVSQKPVRRAVSNHIVRNVHMACIDETANNVTVAIQLGDRCELVLVE